MKRTSQLLFVAMLAAGCGGGGQSGPVTQGDARLVIEWPERTRLIPIASNSITVAFLSGTTVVQTRTVARPDTGTSTVVSFGDLPTGSLRLRAEAFPSTDGTGTAQASASKTVTIVANQVTPVSIVMASTIASVLVSPSTVNLKVGETVTLSGTPTDSLSRTVLISTSAAEWTSSATSVATVSSTGVVTALGAGTTNVRFRDTESGKSGVAVVNVSSGTGDANVGID